jgi:hypothetical protein
MFKEELVRLFCCYINFLKAKNPKHQKDEWDLTLQVRGGSPSQVF